MPRISVLLCLAALLSVSYTRRRPFRSIKAPAGKYSVLVLVYSLPIALNCFVAGKILFFRHAETVENYIMVVPTVRIKEQGDGVSHL